VIFDVSVYDQIMLASVAEIGLKLGMMPTEKVAPIVSEKDEHLRGITERESWLRDSRHICRVVANVANTKIGTTLEALCALENMTLGQVRMVHDLSLLEARNSSPRTIEDRDTSVESYGGIMWGSVRDASGGGEILDLERESKVGIPSTKGLRIGRMHFLPAGNSEKIPGLGKQTYQILAIDMIRFADGIASYKPSLLDQEKSPNVLMCDTNYYMARVLNVVFGMKIGRLWNGPSKLDSFTSWDDLLPDAHQINANIWVTKEELVSTVWDRANVVIASTVNKYAKGSNLRFRQLELALRRTMINIFATDGNKVDDGSLREWWDLQKPGFYPDVSPVAEK